MSKEFNYQMFGKVYVLHEGNKAIGQGLHEVSIGFDKKSGTLHRHGSPGMVSAWIVHAKSKLVLVGAKGMADDLVSITGRFPLDELNKCIRISGHALKMWQKIQDGSLVQEPENVLN